MASPAQHRAANAWLTGPFDPPHSSRSWFGPGSGRSRPRNSAARGPEPTAAGDRRRTGEKAAACRGAAQKRGPGVPTEDSGSRFRARRRAQAAASLPAGGHLACRDAPARTMRAAVAAPCLRWGHRWSLPPSARARASHLAHPRAPRLARWRVSSYGRPEDAAELAGWCGSCCTEAAELRKVSDHRTVIVHVFSGTAQPPRPHHESASVPTKTVNNPNKKMRYWRGYSKACPCAPHKGEFIHTTVKIQFFLVEGKSTGPAVAVVLQKDSSAVDIGLCREEAGAAISP